MLSINIYGIYFVSCILMLSINIYGIYLVSCIMLDFLLCIRVDILKNMNII